MLSSLNTEYLCQFRPHMHKELIYLQFQRPEEDGRHVCRQISPPAPSARRQRSEPWWSEGHLKSRKHYVTKIPSSVEKDLFVLLCDCLVYAHQSLTSDDVTELVWVIFVAGGKVGEPDYHQAQDGDQYADPLTDCKLSPQKRHRK